MSIGILYERSKTEELGIKLTAEELGIDLVYLPFRKVSVCIEKGRYTVKSKGKNYSPFKSRIYLFQQVKNPASFLERRNRNSKNCLHSVRPSRKWR